MALAVTSLLPADAVIVERAPAKLNLDLILTGRRPNGYHELDSVVAFADVGDELRFERADDLRIECTGRFADDLPAGDGNIVRRAALRLAESAGVAPRATVHLDKRLPVASGIGGGSADAAAALRGLARLWDVPANETILVGRTALVLGSDVLACLGSRSARMRGIGELIEPLPDLPRLDLVLANPGVPLSTAAVFAAVEPSRFGWRQEDLPEVLDLRWLRRGRNDLEAPARRLLPAIGEALSALAAAPGCRLARMSGSGPTCFGLFDGPAAAREAAAWLASARPNWWVCPCAVGDLPA
jgi:4-diphosphocytidyl-2-C-methyl-D-erythritol kinase